MPDSSYKIDGSKVWWTAAQRWAASEAFATVHFRATFANGVAQVSRPTEEKVQYN